MPDYKINVNFSNSDRGEEYIANNPDSLAMIPFSSGTTGPPKGVQLTHRNIISSILIGSHETKIHKRSEVQEQEKMFCILPFFHIFRRF